MQETERAVCLGHEHLCLTDEQWKPLIISSASGESGIIIICIEMITLAVFSKVYCREFSGVQNDRLRNRSR